ncbi:MAG: hypothetical protein JOZ25_02365 [Actinobacteria bacterium]|nr:hypothetical protein [Actinomycetota bacterium]
MTGAPAICAGALAVGGWALAIALAARVRTLAARIRAVGDCEHELRGALTAFALVAGGARRTPAGRRIAESLESEMARARRALAQLTAARTGAVRSSPTEPVALERLVRSAVLAWSRRRPMLLDWRAGDARVPEDRGAVAQALGNLLSNAVEHGSGAVGVRAERDGKAVRLEVVNACDPEHGRGLRIARQSAAGAGGTVDFAVTGAVARAELVLPVEA